MVLREMNRLQAIAMTLAATAITATAAPRVALVRVKDIYAGLQSTADLQKEIKAERDLIMKDQRAEVLRKTIAELQSLQTRLSDKNNPLDDATSKKLARSYEIKRQEAQTLQKEFESYRTEQEKQINRKMVTGMRTSLDKIMETANRLAKEQGYDMVFDSSGNTNTGVAFVLYQKKSPDLTDDVKAALKDSAPPAAAAPAETTAPEKPQKK
jgi:Skp family chaperone for outer membrane proteins